MDADQLAMARRHVLRGQRVVERQRKLVARKKAIGEDATASEALLETFERTLALLEDHLRLILKEQQLLDPLAPWDMAPRDNFPF